MSGTRGDIDPRQGTDCDELRDLLPAYTLGATTPEETARVRTLLPLCPEAAEEFAEYAMLSGVLVESVEAVQPRAAVKSSLMARLAAQESARGAVDAQKADSSKTDAIAQLRRDAIPTVIDTADAKNRVPTSDRRVGGKAPARRLSLGWALAAAAAVLLIATNAYWLAQINTQQAELRQAQEDLVRSTSRRDDALALMSNIDTERLGLQSTAQDTIRVATIYWNSATNEVALVTNQLPELASDQTYQLWLLDENGAHSAGIFNLDDRGWGWLKFQPDDTLTDYDALGISIEPAGGSDQPTTQPVAVGQVSA